MTTVLASLALESAARIAQLSPSKQAAILAFMESLEALKGSPTPRTVEELILAALEHLEKQCRRDEALHILWYHLVKEEVRQRALKAD